MHLCNGTYKLWCDNLRFASLKSCLRLSVLRVRSWHGWAEPSIFAQLLAKTDMILRLIQCLVYIGYLEFRRKVLQLSCNVFYTTAVHDDIYIYMYTHTC